MKPKKLQKTSQKVKKEQPNLKGIYKRGNGVFELRRIKVMEVGKANG